jgi:hypothetical protein
MHAAASQARGARPAATTNSSAFVALEREAAVAVLRGRPWRLASRLRVPAGPHNVAASPDGRFVAVSSPPADAVTIIDARRTRVRTRVRVAGRLKGVKTPVRRGIRVLTPFTRDERARRGRSPQCGCRVRRIVRGGRAGACRPTQLGVGIAACSPEHQSRSGRRGRTRLSPAYWASTCWLFCSIVAAPAEGEKMLVWPSSQRTS